MTYHNHSKDDEGFGGCILAIALFFAILLLTFLFGKSIASKKEIIVENNNLTSYVEAAEKLKLSYEIKNSGDKKKIIISFSE